MNPAVPEAKHWAKIPRAVVLHRMETSECLDARLFWAIILWSWCGPDVSPDGSVVLKDEHGWIKRGPRGKPIPAMQKDLLELLGLAPGMKGNLSRAASRLMDIGSIGYGASIPGCKGAKVMYPIQEPPFQKKAQLSVLTTLEGPWYVGSTVVRIEQLPEDPDARTAAIEWLNGLNIDWNQALKDLRTEHHERLVQGASEHGILIERSKKSLLAESQPPASQPASEEPPPPEQPKPAGRLVEDSQNGSSKPTPPPEEGAAVRSYVRTIPQPGLTPEIEDEIVQHVATPEALEQFKEETRPEKIVNARTWKYFVSIAKRVAADAPRYAAAKANGGNGHSPPKSRSEMRAEAFERKMQAQEKSRGG